jgi:hypothetical protein
MPVAKRLTKPISPAIIYAALAVLFIVFVRAGIPCVNLVCNIAEQDVFWMALQVTLYLYFILSIATTLWFRNWFKQYWYVNAVIFIIAGFLLLMIQFNR